VLVWIIGFETACIGQLRVAQHVVLLSEKVIAYDRNIFAFGI